MNRLIPLALPLAALALGGCPKGPKKTTGPRTVKSAPEYPYRGWSTRVDGRVHVFSHTKTRALGVRFDRVRGGIMKPAALVGVDKRRGQVQWQTELPLKFRDPLLPWSFEVAHNATYLASWVEGGRILAFDIYGREAWKTKAGGYLGVSTLGEGFVSARGSKIYFFDRAKGKPTAAADLGAPITAPLTVLREGEIVAVTGDFLVGVNLDKSDKVVFRHRLRVEEGLRAVKPQVVGDTIVVGSQAVPIVIKTAVTRFDPKTLKPRWAKLLPGRVRSHNSLDVLGNEIRLIARQPGKQDLMFRLDARNGNVKGRIPARAKAGCTYGSKLRYCVTAKAVTAYDKNTLNKVWTRQMFDDVTAHQHFAHGSIFYIAEGSKVVGVDDSGRVRFSFEPKVPRLRPTVNRILGVFKGVLVITIVDWINTKGQVWGVDLATGKRKWMKPLPAPAYTEKAVQLVAGRVIWAETVFMRSAAANNGVILGWGIHGLRAPKGRIPQITVKNENAIWIERAGQLARVSAQTARPYWRTALKGRKIVTATRSFLFAKALGGKIEAIDLKNGRTRWKIAYDATLTPKIAEATDTVFFSHVDKTLIVDSKTGAIKNTSRPGGWQLTMVGNDPLLVQVLTSRPKAAGTLEGVAFDRSGGKTSRKWFFSVPRSKRKEAPLPSCVRGVFPWFHATGDMVLLPYRGGRCLWAVDLEEGKIRWKTCALIWPAPPRHFRSKLYVSTGTFLGNQPDKEQGLFEVSEDDGKHKQLFKIPRAGNERFMWPQFGPIRRGEFYVLTQGGRLRQFFVAAPR